MSSTHFSSSSDGPSVGKLVAPGDDHSIAQQGCKSAGAACDSLDLPQLVTNHLTVASVVRVAPGHHTLVAEESSECHIGCSQTFHFSKLLLHRTAVTSVVGISPGDHRPISSQCRECRGGRSDRLYIPHPHAMVSVSLHGAILEEIGMRWCEPSSLDGNACVNLSLVVLAEGLNFQAIVLRNLSTGLPRRHYSSARSSCDTTLPRRKESKFISLFAGPQPPKEHDISLYSKFAPSRPVIVLQPWRDEVGNRHVARKLRARRDADKTYAGLSPEATWLEAEPRQPAMLTAGTGVSD